MSDVPEQGMCSAGRHSGVRHVFDYVIALHLLSEVEDHPDARFAGQAVIRRPKGGVLMNGGERSEFGHERGVLINGGERSEFAHELRLPGETVRTGRLFDIGTMMYYGSYYDLWVTRIDAKIAISDCSYRILRDLGRPKIWNLPLGQSSCCRQRLGFAGEEAALTG